jgi:hypothetical protein
MFVLIAIGEWLRWLAGFGTICRSAATSTILRLGFILDLAGICVFN